MNEARRAPIIDLPITRVEKTKEYSKWVEQFVDSLKELYKDSPNSLADFVKNFEGVLASKPPSLWGPA
jgi:hypothetical protein